MSRGYSLDMRERVIALVEGGLSRRAAARRFMIAGSSAIKWFKRLEETGSFAEKPGGKREPSPLAAHADWLLDLVGHEPDLTLAEVVVRILEERQFKTTDSSVSRFYLRHGVSFKKNAARQRTASRGRRKGA
jgi:transposase